MAENFAQAFVTTAASTAGTDYVNAIVAMLSHASQTRWTVTNSSPGKALLTCVATGSQVVLHGAALQVAIGLAPDGGVTSWDTSPTASVWTGLRNITQNTADYTATLRQVHLAVYEDALGFFIQSNIAGWRLACLVGKVFEPLDESDVANLVGVDGMLLGNPTNVNFDNGQPGAWLRGGTGANWVAHASCMRYGNAFRPIWAFGNRFTDPVSTALARIGTTERLLPFLVHELVSGGQGGLAGSTKYLRQWRNYLPHLTRLASDDLASSQAWLGWQVHATTVSNNQVVLWAKTETTV